MTIGLLRLSVFAAVFASAGLCNGGFLNGSFEEPAIPGLFFQDAPSSLPGWTAPSGLAASFNLHGSVWPSQDGLQHVEFDSPDAVLEQTIASLQVGTEYSVLFGLAGNPDRQAVYGLRLEVRDSTSVLATQDYSVSSVGFTRDDVGWRDESLTFEATEETATFVFSRTDGEPDGWGPDLDNVRLFHDDSLLFSGDFNGDGNTNMADFAIMTANFNASPATFEQGDNNFDGRVNLRDFLEFRTRFNAQAQGAASVPEPAGMTLALTGLAMIAAARRRRPTVRPGDLPCDA